MFWQLQLVYMEVVVVFTVMIIISNIVFTKVLTIKYTPLCPLLYELFPLAASHFIHKTFI